MDIQAVIEKVRKLRALATSTNEHEAAAAAAAAERIFAEHGLTEAELEVQTGEGEKPTQDDAPLHYIAKRSPYWKRRLGSLLAHAHDCSGVYTWTRDPAGNWTQAHKLVGRPSDVATVRYLFAWLSTEIERLATTTKGKGRAWMNAYRMGAVDGIADKMREEKKATRQEARASAGAFTSQAIVLLDNRQKEAEAERNRLYPNLGKGAAYSGTIRSGDGYSSGQRDGRQIHVGAALGAGSGKLLNR